MIHKNAIASGVQSGPRPLDYGLMYLQLSQKNKFIKIARIFYIERYFVMCLHKCKFKFCARTSERMLYLTVKNETSSGT